MRAPRHLTVRIFDGEKEILQFYVQRNSESIMPLNDLAMVKVNYSAEVDEEDRMLHEIP